MKKSLILLAALALTTTGASMAQTAPAAKALSQPAAGQKADPQTEQLVKELGLANDQKDRIAKILQARNRDMQALQAKAAGQDASKSMADLKARYDGQLKEAMTAAQFAKYQQMH